jgi:MFS family permease
MKQSINKNRIQPYITWFIVTAFVFFQFFLQTATSVFSESWASDFKLNKVELSNLSASFFYSYVLMQIPVGILYDRFKAKRILIIAAAFVSSGCFLLAIAKSYELAILGRIFMGIGSSFGFIGMLKVIINNFKVNEFAFMVGLSEALSMSFITFGIITLAYFLKFYSWRISMFICAILAFILLFAIIFFLKEQK